VLLTKLAELGEQKREEMKRKKKDKWKLVLLTKLAKLGEYKGRNEKKKKRINEKWC
jgi:hypothetical protein